jgi:hypothetical protein
MLKLTIETDTVSHAKFLSTFLKTVSLVKSVKIEPETDPVNIVNEPTGEYDWTNPSRPATDEEFEQMINECEASPSLTAKEAKALTIKEIKEWRKSRK